MGDKLQLSKELPIISQWLPETVGACSFMFAAKI
jgi:hypothetical protein